VFYLEQIAFNEYTVSDGHVAYYGLTWLEAISLVVYLEWIEGERV
jgi:hypothetical protein